MSGSLVTLAEMKGMLKIDHSDDDAMLSLLGEMATVEILRFMKTDGEPYTDSSGEIVPGNVPGDIKVATIMLVGVAYRNVDGDHDKAFEPGFLPAPVISLLYGRRDPTVA